MRAFLGSHHEKGHSFASALCCGLVVAQSGARLARIRGREAAEAEAGAAVEAAAERRSGRRWIGRWRAARGGGGRRRRIGGGGSGGGGAGIYRPIQAEPRAQAPADLTTCFPGQVWDSKKKSASRGTAAFCLTRT